MQGTMHASSLLRTPAALKHSSMFSGQPVVSRSVTGLCHISRRTSTCQHFRQSRRASLVVEARYRGSSPDIAERVLAAVPYLLPFLDSFSYGRFLFYQYPIITKFIAPMGPLISLYTSVPFAPLLAFFGVYLGIVQNMQWSRFVRFNAMQAMLLDILLILPRLAEQVFSTPTSGWGLQAYITAQNSVWIFIAASVLYGVGASVLGQAARIPLVADAAEQQVR